MSERKQPLPQPGSFAACYPNIAAWVRDGWVEIGRDEYSHSFVRALDIGGVVWEGAEEYASLEDVLQDLDGGIADRLEEIS